MVRSMFSGVAGLRAHQTKMDVIGNNIANVNTYGFKAGRVTFKDSFYQTLSGSSAAGGSFGGGNASQIGYGSQVNSIDVLHTNGGFAPTDDPADIMITGSGYFLVGPLMEGGLNPNNGDVSKLQLTRVGIFRFDGSGNLVDPNRNLVYGFKGYSSGDKLADLPTNGVFTTSDGTNFKVAGNTITKCNADGTPAATAFTQPEIDKIIETDTTVTPSVVKLKVAVTDQTQVVPIKMPTGKKVNSISYGKDGTITAIDEDERVITIGRIAVANVPNPSALEMIQSSYYRAKDNTGIVTAHTAGEGTTGQIQSGGLEMANVDLSKEFTEMITTQRGFQANTRIITVSDEMLQELVNLKR